ncbi:putative RNA-binding motif protein, X-linked 2 [Blattamonas nauphoetae]|uniref:RNA-binding motif protein, X-linked 2 n=1 Tax=Blattamonas nauphoetae TaxID=2049346 RepID=A0ABQ9YCM4_9EUKA|nr:putative RNA-binding motif protein, X-linked 2 [Blattamonas nauphoetae]
MQKINRIKELSEDDLRHGLQYGKGSWHDTYRHSAWIHVGGLDYGLSEGDLLQVFSQYGEITEINYPRDSETGKPKGFCFLKYEDARSCVLSVDNMNGISLLNRPISVDHVSDYRRLEPKEEDEPQQSLNLRELSHSSKDSEKKHHSSRSSSRHRHHRDKR